MDKIKLPIEWHDLAEEFLDADGQIITIDRITDALNTAADKDRQIAELTTERDALLREVEAAKRGCDNVYERLSWILAACTIDRDAKHEIEELLP